MASFETTIEIIKPELTQLNDRIKEVLSSANPLMNMVIDSYLKTKGKQIRPILLLLTAKMMGQINDKTIASAVAVELLHNATLIHDDVVDNSMMRRNAPTINAVWDNHIAVLVGDFFLSTAMHQAVTTTDIDIIESLCLLGKMLSIGEIDQIYNARYHALTEEAYFRIINAKTASLFEACSRMGCYSIDVRDERVEKMVEFANCLGLCFQIRDDIFDYFSDQKVGKPTGNDLKEGKITLPLLHVLLDTSLPEHDAMMEMTQKSVLNDEEISALIAYAVDNGGIEYAYAKMQELRDHACAILDEFPACPARNALMVVLDTIISRDH